MKESSFLLLMVCVISQWCFGFSFLPYWRTRSSYLQQSPNSSPDSLGVETLSIRSLDQDHDTEGLRMATSVALWLDREWMPLEVHREIANSVRDSYVVARNANEHEVAVIMFKIAQDLEVQWTDFDQKGAFTNAWDVANYVSDYLAYRIGIQGCECSAKVIDPGLDSVL
jgi:hypothetical protein